MQPNITFYGFLLQEEKWVSKTDFIYKLKVNCDCSGDEHGKFLEFLYRLKFSRVKRTRSGGIVFF